MTNSSLFKKFLFALSVIFVVSCDKDFTELGSDITESDIHHNNIVKYYGKVSAYDSGTGVVQSNNLPLNALGIYDNPAFGKTAATFVTQVSLAAYNPVIGNRPKIDSVYLYIPYQSTKLSTGTDGAGTYRLDSIYGNTELPMKLKIYRNGYFLRSSDPGASVLTGQKYYSDEKPLVDANKTDLLFENDQFVFSAAEVQRKVTVDGAEIVKERLAPGIFTHLDTTYFQAAIINQPSRLINENVFKEYFRGLYFNIEQQEGGAMALANFNEGKITIIYQEDYTNPGTGALERAKKTMVLNLTGNTINFFENTYKAQYTSALATADAAEGDAKLYVKGGEGSMAIIDILNDDDLALLKKDDAGNRVLINEANLVFHVDEETMGNFGQHPFRVYLYDLKNKRPVADYYIDNTSTSNIKFNKSVHGGRLLDDSNGINRRYKIRITNHLNNILNKDSTNVKLGLVVTENINLIANAGLKTPFTAGTTEVKEVPAASVMSPLGTVLFGSNSSVPEAKRLRLEIFYTKPN